MPKYLRANLRTARRQLLLRVIEHQKDFGVFCVRRVGENIDGQVLSCPVHIHGIRNGIATAPSVRGQIFVIPTADVLGRCGFGGNAKRGLGVRALRIKIAPNIRVRFFNIGNGGWRDKMRAVCKPRCSGKHGDLVNRDARGGGAARQNPKRQEQRKWQNQFVQEMAHQCTIGALACDTRVCCVMMPRECFARVNGRAFWIRDTKDRTFMAN